MAQIVTADGRMVSANPAPLLTSPLTGAGPAATAETLAPYPARGGPGWGWGSAPDQQSTAGWSARLNLRFEARGDAPARTVLAERSHVGPLRLLKPLYPEGEDICHAIIVHPPGGIVADDHLAVTVQVDRGASALATTPGAQKWYRSTGRAASADTRLVIADGARLEWLPQETMVFNGARAAQSLEVLLAPEARFFGWEMLCLGRTTRGERFLQGQFRQQIRLLDASTGAPIWRESMTLAGDDALLQSPLGLRGLPVAATAWIAFPDAGQGETGSASASVLAQVRATLGDAAQAAASSPQPGLVVIKALGEAPEAVRNLLIAVWKSIRLQVFSRAAVSPRIWST